MVLVYLTLQFCSRQTILIKLDTYGASELAYVPGDHVAIFPKNSPDMVESILARLHNAPPADQIIKTEILQEKSTPLGNLLHWCIVFLRQKQTRMTVSGLNFPLFRFVKDLGTGGENSDLFTAHGFLPVPRYHYAP